MPKLWCEEQSNIMEKSIRDEANATDADELPDSALEDIAGGADSTGQASSSQSGLTLPRGGWDGNHIETMRRCRLALH